MDYLSTALFLAAALLPIGVGCVWYIMYTPSTNKIEGRQEITDLERLYQQEDEGIFDIRGPRIPKMPVNPIDNYRQTASQSKARCAVK